MPEATQVWIDSLLGEACAGARLEVFDAFDIFDIFARKWNAWNTPKPRAAKSDIEQALAELVFVGPG